MGDVRFHRLCLCRYHSYSHLRSAFCHGRRRKRKGNQILRIPAPRCLLFHFLCRSQHSHLSHLVDFPSWGSRRLRVEETFLDGLLYGILIAVTSSVRLGDPFRPYLLRERNGDAMDRQRGGENGKQTESCHLTYSKQDYINIYTRIPSVEGKEESGLIRYSSQQDGV